MNAIKLSEGTERTFFVYVKQQQDQDEDFMHFMDLLTDGIKQDDGQEEEEVAEFFKISFNINIAQCRPVQSAQKRFCVTN